MIFILLLYLILFALLAYLHEDRDITAPSVVFCLSFLLCAAIAALYSEKWRLMLHLNTFFVIAGGVLEFCLVSALIKKVSKGRVRYTGTVKPGSGKIQDWKLIVFLIFVLVEMIAYCYYLPEVTGEKSLTAAMRALDQTKFTGERMLFPRWVGWSRDMVNAAGYWFACVSAWRFVMEKKLIHLESLIFVCAMVNCLLNGGRTGAIMMLLAFLAVCVILTAKKRGTRHFRLTNLQMLLLIVCAVVFLVGFRYLAVFYGRTVRKSVVDYLAVYCGAQIKNLDIFLQEVRHAPEEWGGQTFVSLANYLNRKTGATLRNTVLDIPFRRINGFSLGNVYTTFYSYIYDFGYIGEAVLVFIMAAASQLIYEGILSEKSRQRPSCFLLLYSWIFGTLLLSFFSNKFYETVLGITIVKMLLCWFLMDFFFYRIRTAE